MKLLIEILTDPLNGQGYQFWSGIGSGSPLIVGIFIFFKRHNCHEPYCWRLQWKHHPTNDHVVCKVHHPDHPKKGKLPPRATIQRIVEEHE